MCPQYYTNTKDVTEVDENEPITVHQMSSNISSSNTKYLVVGGIINDFNIKSINVNFRDNTMVNLIIGEDKNYFYAKYREVVQIKSIEALDEKLNIIYKWSTTGQNN